MSVSVITSCIMHERTRIAAEPYLRRTISHIDSAAPDLRTSLLILLLPLLLLIFVPLLIFKLILHLVV